METAPALNGAALRSARERAGLSQSQLARRVGAADGQRISRWERGEARPRSATQLSALADVLGVTPQSLLEAPAQPVTLRWLRFAAGMTVEDLAASAHISVATVKRWESAGVQAPTDETVRNVADALQAPPRAVRDALLSAHKSAPASR